MAGPAACLLPAWGWSQWPLECLPLSLSYHLLPPEYGCHGNAKPCRGPSLCPAVKYSGESTCLGARHSWVHIPNVKEKYTRKLHILSFTSGLTEICRRMALSNCSEEVGDGAMVYMNFWLENTCSQACVCVCVCMCACMRACVRVSHSVVSNSLWPHGLQPARLLGLWNSPDKNTGVGCHFLL